MLGLLVAATLLVPQTAAHSAPEPLGNAVHVLADEGEDSFYWYDGYDLFHLHAREAYIATQDASGLVFRFTLYGGFAPGPGAQTLHVDLQATGPDGETTLRLSTTDDRNWSGDLTPVVVNVTEDPAPYTGVTVRMQAFASYTQLGAEPGETIENVTMYSYADEDLRDIAPGGVYAPGSGGRGEVPTESRRVTDAIELNGTGSYVDVVPSAAGSNVTLAVENLLENGQHVSIHPGQAPMWNVSGSGPMATSLDGGDTHTFRLTAQAGPNATQPLPIEVRTDLGGRETVYLGVNGSALETGLEPANLQVDPSQPTKESPGLGVAVAGLLLAGSALLRRR